MRASASSVPLGPTGVEELAATEAQGEPNLVRCLPHPLLRWAGVFVLLVSSWRQRTRPITELAHFRLWCLHQAWKRYGIPRIVNLYFRALRGQDSSSDEDI